MSTCDTTDKGWQVISLTDTIYDNTSKWVRKKVGIIYHNHIYYFFACSTILIYAHEHYDSPVIDAVDLFRPSKVEKFAINEKRHTYYTLELETSAKLKKTDALCNADSEYSYSKEITDRFI